MKRCLFLCGGVTATKTQAKDQTAKVVELATHGPKQNVNVQVENLAKVFMKDLSPRLLDFIEIASYVYAADAATRRDGAWTDDYTTESWGRDFRFVIPVRDAAFWKSPLVKQALVDALNTLSDDFYAFDFRALKSKENKQGYFVFGPDAKWPFDKVPRVLMFSGGLDSLAGALESGSRGEKLVLVSHRPVTTLDSRQKRLFQKLQDTLTVPMVRIPVWVNKEKKLGREHTQRTRSFLFAALGTIVAESLDAGGVRFFENGIVSVNLAVSDEVLRARASRTTNPYALLLLEKLCRLVVGRDFVVDNPYALLTKKEVVLKLKELGKEDFVPYTCSCAHTGMFHSSTQWHCGGCSQCIDRRFAVIAAGLESMDPEHDYLTDVFTGPRKENYEQNMAVNYVKHGLDLDQMGENEMVAQFSTQFSRAVRGQPRPSEFAEKLVAMHKRHGETVRVVLQKQLQKHVNRFVDTSNALPESSMLSLVTGRKHLEPSWHRYCDRIADLLRDGLPRACKTHKPTDEPHLQEICDGILNARNMELVREYPFMQWSSSLTKPDWSFEPLHLWVELKYVRKRADVRVITEDISSDITKYGDNKRRVFFVVYDPFHLVVDEDGFSRDIVKTGTMRVLFVR